MHEDKSSKSGAHIEDVISIAEGSGVIFLGRILDRTIQYLYVIAIARMLGRQSFGLFMLGLSIINIAGVISRLGLETGALRFVALYNSNGDNARIKGVIVQTLKYTLLLSVIIAAGLFLVVGPLLGEIFNKSELEIVIKLLCLSIPFFSLMIMLLAFTRGTQVMRYTVYSQYLFWPICNLVLVTIFFVLGFGLRGIMVAYVISVLLASILSLYFFAKTFSTIRQTRAISEPKKLLRFSVPLSLTNLLSLVLIWTDTLMLGYFRSSEEVGVYNAAMKTAMLTNMILFCFIPVFSPMISDLYNKKQMHKLSHLFKTITKWIYTGSLPLFLLMALLSKEVMTLFGQEFMAGCSCLIVLAFAQFVNAGVGSVGTLLIMSGKQDLMMYNTLGICILNISLNCLLIPSWGMLGASIASGISIITFNLVMLLEVRILLKMHPYHRRFLDPTLFAIVASAIVLLVKSVLTSWTGIQKLLVLIPLFLLIFGLLVHKFGSDEQDRLIVLRFKGKLLEKIS